nr:MAG TPA: hypothetical protein [Caudoviricetes sp.]
MIKLFPLRGSAQDSFTLNFIFILISAWNAVNAPRRNYF